MIVGQLTVDIAIISDTHMPKGHRRLPAACVERLRAADLIVHAGDLSTVDVLEEIQGYGRLVAVHGNVDDAGVRAVLPTTVAVQADGGRLVVIHDAGPSTGRLERMRRRFPKADVVIFGHSHIPLHQSAEPDGGGLQIFNPGSPTERRRSPHHTMGMARTRSDGRLEFELIELD
jgi:putative phosphoesterase